MSLAKPLAGGLPIGAVLLRQKVADVMKPGGCLWGMGALGLLVCACMQSM
jgi:acetylornithine/succinyldiaminopimelate/putrescine aminotransferase